MTSALAATPEAGGQIAAVRRFTRFYTQRIGVLQEGLLRSPFSLTEARVLYELAHRDGLNAATLCKELGLDPGYLSRILAAFETRGLLAKHATAGDGRRNTLALTPKGRRAFAPLDVRSRQEVGALLGPLAGADRTRLTAAMRTIERLLDPAAERAAPYILRPPQPGDMGWVVGCHGALYAEEYGWDEQFEALVAGIVAEFVQKFDARRERCWIAERDGENVGSVFLVRQSERVAKLRLLIVDPKARGFGIGARLVEECILFARAHGYRTLALWTNNVLTAARHIYEKKGFRLVREEPHHSFGHDLVGETWELKL
jgi:DNA-binding MarR family transcriptional regulator/GNAT superfamily N-acetyltransferase